LRRLLCGTSAEGSRANCTVISAEGSCVDWPVALVPKAEVQTALCR